MYADFYERLRVASISRGRARETSRVIAITKTIVAENFYE